MKITTFYRIYYEHRFKKAKLFLKLYLMLILPFKYLYNYFYFPKKIDLDDHQKKNNFLKEKNLSELFEYFNSDKGDYFQDQYMQSSKRNFCKIQGHGYAKFYLNYFEELKHKKIEILEIGSFKGNAVAAMFYYFNDAFMYAADIFPDLFRFNSKRIKNFYVDSSNEVSIQKNIINRNINLDIIIEDASHRFKDQIISLFKLFRILKKNGIFIIEELDFPDTRLDMNLKNEKPTLRTILKNIINKEPFESAYINKDDKDYFLQNFSSIEIFKGNFNEIAIIKKK